MGGPDGGTTAVASLQHHFQPAGLNVKLGHERFSLGCCLPVCKTPSQSFGLVWSIWFCWFAISPCERCVCGDKIPSAFCSPIDHKVCLQCAFSLPNSGKIAIRRSRSATPTTRRLSIRCRKRRPRTSRRRSPGPCRAPHSCASSRVLSDSRLCCGRDLGWWCG